MARLITGTLTLPDGSAVAGANIHFTAKRNEATTIVTGVDSYVTTTGGGSYSQTIENGYYSVSLSYAAIAGAEPRRWHLGDVWVSNGAPVTLNALLSVNGSTADPTDAALLQLLVDAQQARDDAVAAAQETEDAAANLLAQKGEPNGIMPLDANGLAPASHLPSYVDDVLEFPTYASLPASGETGKIYVVTTAGTQGGVPFPANQQFRWTGTQYVKLVASPGTTDNVVEGSSNLYFTQARVRSTVLTGLTTVTNAAIVAADTLLAALGKIQAQLNNKVNNDDSRLTNSREWTAATIAQAEAEAGTATTRRAFTAQRVRQAIVAWWNSVSTAVGRSVVTAADAAAARTAIGAAQQGGTVNTSQLSGIVANNNLPATATRATLTQAQAESETSTAAGFATGQRIRQAITAWWSGYSGATGRELATAPTADAARVALELGDAAIADVVGTMAEGAIIERGSNANGEYVRFADGTQICALHKIFDATGVNFAVSNYTLPATLATTDGAGCYCSPDAQTNSWTLAAERRCYSTAGLVNSGTVAAGLTLPAGNTFTGNIVFYVYVIGRWK